MTRKELAIRLYEIRKEKGATINVNKATFVKRHLNGMGYLIKGFTKSELEGLLERELAR